MANEAKNTTVEPTVEATPVTRTVSTPKSKWEIVETKREWQESISSIRNLSDGAYSVNDHYSKVRPGVDDKYISLKEVVIVHQDTGEQQTKINIVGFCAHSGYSREEKINILMKTDPAIAMAMSALLQSL